jgi:hypothetical protein
MPTLRRRNADPHAAGPTHLRSSLADAAWAVEDRVVWGATEVFRRLYEIVRWPFERIAWGVESRVVWPIQEEASLWSRPLRAGALASTILLAAAAVAAGVLVSNPSSGGEGPTAVSPEPAARTIPVAPPVAQPPAEEGPVLQGAAPEFGVEAGGGVPKAQAGAEVAAAADAAQNAGAVSAASGAAGAAGGAAGEAAPIAGPGAVKVARRFSTAFVLYETGRDTPAVREAFRQTATPDLVHALMQRPPRLPADVEVPKAKVLNVVAGPKQGDTYTLSVSLLRVGVTSELRIDMKKTPVPGQGTEADGSEGQEKSRWVVTDVLG